MQLCANKIEMSRREIQVNYDIIRFLVENGANKSIVTSKGKTAYDLCEKHSNSAQIRQLLANQTPLYQHIRPLAMISQRDFLGTNRLASAAGALGGANKAKNDGKTLLPKNSLLSASPTVEGPSHRRTRSFASYFILCQK